MPVSLASDWVVGSEWAWFRGWAWPVGVATARWFLSSAAAIEKIINNTISYIYIHIYIPYSIQQLAWPEEKV